MRDMQNKAAALVNKIQKEDKTKEEMKEVQKKLNMLRTSLQEEKSENVEVKPKVARKIDYKVGDRVEKEIKNIQDFGMFVKLEDGVDGFIPTQLASRDFIKNLKDTFKLGQVVLAEIVEIDSEKKRIKLSIKKVQLEKEKNENKELIEKYGVSSSEE